MGETMASDRSAILIGAKAPNNQIFILEADIKRRLPDRIIVDQNHWMEQYPAILSWGIESVQFQKFFGTVSARESAEAGMKIPVVPLSTHNNLKDMRIQSLQPDLLNEYIVLSEEGQRELKEEIERYRPGHKQSTKVDGLDALEMLRSLCDDQKPRNATSITYTATHEFGHSKIYELQNADEDQEGWDALDRLADQNIYLKHVSEELEAATREGRKPREVAGPESAKVPFFPIISS
jgi:predicted phage terminase large subunit-like protein